MKAVILFLLLSLVAVSGCSQPKLSYSDSKFSFNYGKSLEIISVENRPVLVEQTEPAENIVSLWPVGETDVNILVKKELQTKKEMERIMDSGVNDIQAYEMALRKITSQIGDITFSSKQKDFLRFKAVEILTEFEKDGKQISSRSITFFNHSVPYTVEYTSVKEKFPAYQAEFDEIVSSLKIV